MIRSKIYIYMHEFSIFYVGMISHNLGCWTLRAGDGPCNACATIPCGRAGVCLSPPSPPQCTIESCATLLVAEVSILLLRSLNGQVKQLQTNIPWQNTCNTRLAHTQYLVSQNKKGGVCGELSDHSNQWLHCDVKTFGSKAFVME